VRDGEGEVRPTGAGIVDHVLGGYPPGLPLVVAGTSGCGRTVLALQLARGAIERGERVEFVSSEPAPSLIQQAAALDLPLDGALRSEQLALLELDAAAASLVRSQGPAALAEALRRESPDADLLIVDPFTILTAEIVDEPKLREVARAFVKALPVRHLVLTVERERLDSQRGLERVLSELCGAYLVLDREPSGRRTLSVDKTRTGVGASECVEFAIGPGGTHLVGDAMPVSAIGETPADEDVSLAAWVRSTPAESAPRRGRVRPALPPHFARPPQAAPAAAPAEAGPVPPAPAGAPVSPVAATTPATGQAAGPTAAAPAPAAGPRPTVLVVEDTRLQRELIRDWLSDRYEVLTAADGFEAMATLLSHDPDLVILDLIMPRVTGYELLCALRRAGRDVPVLVASSRVQTAGDRLGPLVLGATDFIAKPVSRLELEHKVAMLLQLRRNADRRFDPAEAEALFGQVSASRLLEAEEFRDRVTRAAGFGERHGLASALVRLGSSDAAALEQWIDVASQELRFEDAILRLGKRRALVLLVATGPAEAPKVLDRLHELCEQALGRPAKLTVAITTASPEALDPEPAAAAPGEEGDA
jgi:DNA-binding response OmpR family regulator/archaellum biogenesis ATPase FlaH